MYLCNSIAFRAMRDVFRCREKRQLSRVRNVEEEDCMCLDESRNRSVNCDCQYSNRGSVDFIWLLRTTVWFDRQRDTF